MFFKKIYHKPREWKDKPCLFGIGVPWPGKSPVNSQKKIIIAKISLKECNTQLL